MRKITTLLLVIIVCINLIPLMSTPARASTEENGRIQKMSICYSGRINNAFARQFIATHFDLVDCNSEIPRASEMKTLNPEMKIIGYYDAIMQSPGMSDWSLVNNHEDWFVHTTTGERVKSTRWGGYLMNPNSGWSNYYAQRCLAMLNTYPSYDGIFADDVIYDLRDDWQWDHSQSEFSPGMISFWPFWMKEHIQNVKNVIGEHLLMANPWKYTLFGDIAGAMLWENFIHNEEQSSSHPGYGGSYQFGCLAINLLHEQALQGTLIATHSGCQRSSPDSERMDWLSYCLGCLLLAVHDIDSAYFAWMFYGQDSTNGYAPVMDTVFGQPLQNYTGRIQESTVQVAQHPLGGDGGSYSYCGGVFVREFQHYYVIVNICPSFSSLYDYTGLLPDGTTYTVNAKKALFIKKDPIPNPPPQQTYYVSTTGDDTNPGSLSQPWRTIQKAADTVGAGALVYIRGGTYNEKVKFSTPWTTWTTFCPYENEHVRITGAGIPGRYDGILLFTDGCAYSRISGLELTDASYAGVFVLGGAIDHIRIDNCTIHDCQASGIYAYSSQYTTGKYVKDMEFDSNLVYDVNNGNDYNPGGFSAQEAISFSGVLGFHIHHNTLRRYGKEGIDVKSGCRNGLVHHNTIDTSLAAPAFQWDYNHIGIYVDGYHRVNKNIQVYCNYITGYGGSGIVLNAERPELGGCIENIYVFNNVVDLSGLPGHTQFRSLDSLDDCCWTHVYICCNTFLHRDSRNPPRIFPSAQHLTNLVVQNNIFAGVSSALISFQNTASTDAPGRITLANNLYYRFNGPVHNQWKDGVDQYWGAQSIRSNPGFVSSSDLHLCSSSPAIDSGKSVMISFDFDGNPRPYGSGCDIGAYEYHPLAVSLQVSTHPATQINTTSAVLNGYLDASGIGLEGCSVWFEYGTTTGYGAQTSMQIISAGQGFSEWIEDLEPSTMYHFRTVASDGLTSVNGSDMLFLTTTSDPLKIFPPSQLQATQTTPTSIRLSWTNGPGCEYSFLVRKTGSYPTSISDGIIRYIGAESSFIDRDLDPFVHYFYRAYSYGSNQLSPGVNFILAQTHDVQQYGSWWAEFSGFLITDTPLQTFFEYSTSPSFPTTPMDTTTLLQYDTSATAYLYNFFGPHWVGQTFTIDSDATDQLYSLQNVSFRLLRMNNPGMISLRLYNTDPGGLPFGPVISTGCLDAKTLPFSNDWVTFSMSPCTLVAHMQYALVLNVSGSAADFLYVAVDPMTPSYSNGKLFVSHDGAITYNTLEADACFQISITPLEPPMTAQTIPQQGSSGYCNVTQQDLKAGQMYWYSLIAEDTTGNTIQGMVRTLLTNPEPPQILSISPSPVNTSALVCWLPGDGANRTLLLKGDQEHPQTPFDGTILYNGSAAFTWVPDWGLSNTSYYSLCSLTTWGALKRYSTMVHLMN